MNIEVTHTYTVNYFQMTVDGSSYCLKQCFDPNDGETKVTEIIEMYEGEKSMPGKAGPLQHGSDEWKRVESLFEKNNTTDYSAED